jgi:hypothetical protein
VREIDGERHHLRRGAIEMEIVSNSCVNKKPTHENMKEEHDVPLGWHHGK